MATTKLQLGTLNSAGLPQSAIQQTTSYTTNGFSNDVNQVQFPLQIGVPIQNQYTYKVVPATTTLGCVGTATSTATAGAWTIPLVSTSQPATTGGSIEYATQIVIIDGKQCVEFDCERCLFFSFTTPTTALCNITVQGYDYRRVPVTIFQQVPIGSGASENGFFLNQPLSAVSSIQFSANPFGTTAGVQVHVGNGNGAGHVQLGLPYFLPNLSFAGSEFYWNDDVVTITTSTVIPGVNWRLNPVNVQTYYNQATPPSITTTSPTRGYVIPDGPPEGNAMLVINMYIYGADSEVNAELLNLYGSTLSWVGVNLNDFTIPQYVWPYMTKYDLVGMQPNSNLQTGDSPALITYNNLITATS